MAELFYSNLTTGHFRRTELQKFDQNLIIVIEIFFNNWFHVFSDFTDDYRAKNIRKYINKCQTESFVDQ